MDELGPAVPVQFTAFHPDYRMLDTPPTPPGTLRRAREIAIANGVRYAYTGNARDPEGPSTYCHRCGVLLIERDWCQLGQWGLTDPRRPMLRAASHWPASSAACPSDGALVGSRLPCRRAPSERSGDTFARRGPHLPSSRARVARPPHSRVPLRSLRVGFSTRLCRYRASVFPPRAPWPQPCSAVG